VHKKSARSTLYRVCIEPPISYLDSRRVLDTNPRDRRQQFASIRSGSAEPLPEMARICVVAGEIISGR
jgi:hypothetical protein